jgi:hypothetical protein
MASITEDEEGQGQCANCKMQNAISDLQFAIGIPWSLTPEDWS